MSGRRVELVGHRGAPRERRENTLPAFAAALALGADAIELDVHLTRDGIAIVHHDPVPRVTGADGAPERRSFPQLAFADVESMRLEGDERIPTLESVLALAAGRATVYVEIKDARAVAESVRVITRSGASCAVHSFDHRVARDARALAPDLPVGLLSSSYLLDTAGTLRAAGARDWWQEWRFIDAALVRQVHDAGGRVVAWTVNDADAAARLVALGVDALCTDLLRVVGPVVGGAS